MFPQDNRIFEQSEACQSCTARKPDSLDGALGLGPIKRGILVPPAGSPTAKFIIVGEAPGRTEAEMLQPFVGESGKLLDNVLQQAGLRREDAWITNTSLCWFNGEKVFLDGCKERLKKELELHPAKFVLLLGNEALEATLGVSGITEQAGFFQQLGGKTYLPTFHPAAALRMDDLIHTLVVHVKKFAKALQEGSVAVQSINVEVIKTKEELETLVAQLSSAKAFTFDLETSAISWEDGQILCASFSIDGNTAYVVPVYKNGITHILDVITLRSYFHQIFESPAAKIAQNAKFDIKWLKQFGVEVKNVAWDTMLAQHLLNENLPVNLNALISYYTDIPKYDDELASHLPNRATSYSQVPCQVLWEYAGRDAAATFQVYQRQLLLIEQMGYGCLFSTITVPLQLALADIEFRGVLVSRDKLTQASAEVTANININEQELLKRVGHTFNYNSPKQLSQVLFVERGLKSGKTTSKGNQSTDAEVLEKLAKKDVVAKTVLELRKLKKLSTTYLDGGKEGGLARHLDSNNRLHCTFKVHGTHTGRLASGEPNMQNIPRGAIRSMFIAEDGYKLLEADYSQAEIRVGAVLSGDKDLISVFDRGEDIHTTVASQLMGKSPDDVTKEERGFAKFVVFGLAYGRGASSIAAQYNMPLQKADEFLTAFFDLYPRFKAWRKEVVLAAMKTRELRNPYGRVRHFPPFGNFADEWERQAFNFPLQSTVADTCNRALVLMHNVLKKYNIDAHIVLTVHDSIVVEAREDLVSQVSAIMKKTMELPIPQINYSLPIELSVADYWGGAK